MKTMHIMGISAIIIISILFVAAGPAGSQNKVDTENIIIAKVIPSDAIQKSLKSGDQIDPDRTIFSKTTIISLIVAVIGIVAFRRNTYI